MSNVCFHAVGRRKKAIARVRLIPGEGNITVNKRNLEEYFGYETLKTVVRQPLVLTETLGKFDVVVNCKGGGFTGSWMFLLNASDRADVAAWAYEAMCWMTMKGVMSGTGSKMLAPRGSATRAQVAAMIQRFSEAQ